MEGHAFRLFLISEIPSLKGQMHHHDDLGSKCAYTCHLSNKTTRKSVLLSTPQIWLMKVIKKWPESGYRGCHYQKWCLWSDCQPCFWLVERYQWQSLISMSNNNIHRSCINLHYSCISFSIFNDILLWCHLNSFCEMNTFLQCKLCGELVHNWSIWTQL